MVREAMELPSQGGRVVVSVAGRAPVARHIEFAFDFVARGASTTTTWWLTRPQLFGFPAGRRLSQLRSYQPEC